MNPRLESGEAVTLLSALAQPTRLAAFRLLMRYRPHGLNAGHIARLLAVPQNTLSSHLSLLENAGLVVSRRDSRNMIYAVAPARADALLAFLADACCSAGPPACEPRPPNLFPSRGEAKATGRPFQILVLCTGNSARSILAEAIFNREGAGCIKAWSAGSKPGRAPNPVAIALLDDLGYDTAGFRSKSWDEFSKPGAPRLDLAITVCDAAAGEACPIFAGAPVKIHWGLEDPTAIAGPAEAKRAAFLRTYRELTTRVTAFVNLPFEAMEPAELSKALNAIGAMDGATAKTLAQAA